MNAVQVSQSHGVLNRSGAGWALKHYSTLSDVSTRLTPNTHEQRPSNCLSSWVQILCASAPLQQSLRIFELSVRRRWNSRP